MRRKQQDYFNELLGKIKRKKANIGIIGLGYVGLPLAIEFARVGFKILGVDVSCKKINLLSKGKSYVTDVSNSDVKRFVVKEKLVKISLSYNILKKADVVCITVPTPLKKTKDPDISFIVSAMVELKKIFHPGVLIVLESTTYPGTTRELIASEIEKMGYKAGKDFFVAYSPERVDPGNPHFNTKNIPKVLGGLTEKCGKLAYELYSTFLENIHIVETVEEAEMAKLLENTFRAVNIGLVNEMTIMCDRMGINIWNVIEAASTKPFGFMPFYPGPGIGGHCIPLDPLYLSYRAKMYNFYNRFIELATDINGNMPRFVLSKLIDILNKAKKPLNGSRILLSGIAYKADVNDIRESPALEIYKILVNENSRIDYYDPFIQEFNEGGKRIKSISLKPEIVRRYDCVVITTPHSDVDYKLILKSAKLIFDTRNVYKGIKSDKITRL
ncbi:nucleotide sugar dehydrogenase [candidate division WOR-3 bacterium]|nr:nucleotide sugar dehydrogenase [candidate division WOR-3 bacterium]